MKRDKWIQGSQGKDGGTIQWESDFFMSFAILLKYPGKEVCPYIQKKEVRTAVAVRFASDASFLPPGNAV